MQVNDVKLTGKSQGEAVNVLRSTRGLVKLLVQREETVLEGGKPAIEVGVSGQFMGYSVSHVVLC